MEVKANWTGSFPCLCHGKWELSVEGKDFSHLLEGRSEMGTKGKYSSWSFNEDFIEEWDLYEDGLEEEDWVAENLAWLEIIAKELNVSEKEKKSLNRKIFEVISLQDWRHNSCGGCI